MQPVFKQEVLVGTDIQDKHWSASCTERVGVEIKGDAEVDFSMQLACSGNPCFSASALCIPWINHLKPLLHPVLASLCDCRHSCVKKCGASGGAKRWKSWKQINWKVNLVSPDKKKLSIFMFWKHWTGILSQNLAQMIPTTERDVPWMWRAHAASEALAARLNSWYGVNSAAISNLLCCTADSSTHPVIIRLEFLHLFIMPQECIYMTFIMLQSVSLRRDSCIPNIHS